MDSRFNPVDLLAAALAEARKGRDEGGIPIGASIFTRGGRLLGSGRNRRVQHNDPSAHGETDAFRNAGRQRSYRDLIMVTTLVRAGHYSGLIRQFGFLHCGRRREPDLSGREWRGCASSASR